MNTFSDFGASFQKDLAQLILENRTFAEQFEEVMEIKYFELLEWLTCNLRSRIVLQSSFFLIYREYNSPLL